MGNWKVEGEECPLDTLTMDMDKCQPCRFFRGATLSSREKGWRVLCNWPRNGSELAQPTSASDLRAWVNER